MFSGGEIALAMFGMLFFGGFVAIGIMLAMAGRNLVVIQAYSKVVKDGGSIERNHWHLWQSVGTRGEYVVLKFDKKGNTLNSTEQRFPNTDEGLKDAIMAFRKAQGV
jgi:hypothetical protein